MLMRLLLVALLLVSATALAEITPSLSTGFDYSSGKYGGATSTEVLYVPVIGKLQFDNFFLKLTVPYIRVSSAGGVVRGMGSFTMANTSKTSTQSGLGDVVASAGYTILESGNLFLDLVGNVKFGTADPYKNLGTGKNDYSAQLDTYYQLDKTTIFATAGYKVVGAPAGIQVNNIAYGTLGVSQNTGDKTSAGVMLDVAQGSNVLSPGARELTVFVANRISQTLKVQANLMKGFSDSSPDYGGGVMVTGYF